VSFPTDKAILFTNIVGRKYNEAYSGQIEST